MEVWVAAGSVCRLSAGLVVLIKQLGLAGCSAVICRDQRCWEFVFDSRLRCISLNSLLRRWISRTHTSAVTSVHTLMFSVQMFWSCFHVWIDLLHLLDILLKLVEGFCTAERHVLDRSVWDLLRVFKAFLAERFRRFILYICTEKSRQPRSNSVSLYEHTAVLWAKCEMILRFVQIFESKIWLQECSSWKSQYFYHSQQKARLLLKSVFWYMLVLNWLIIERSIIQQNLMKHLVKVQVVN